MRNLRLAVLLGLGREDDVGRDELRNCDERERSELC